MLGPLPLHGLKCMVVGIISCDLLFKFFSVQMKLVVELLFFLAIVKYVAAETISFETRLIEAEESDYNEVSLTVKREGGTNGSIDYFCEVCNSLTNMLKSRLNK